MITRFNARETFPGPTTSERQQPLPPASDDSPKARRRAAVQRRERAAADAAMEVYIEADRRGEDPDPAVVKARAREAVDRVKQDQIREEREKAEKDMSDFNERWEAREIFVRAPSPRGPRLPRV